MSTECVDLASPDGGNRLRILATIQDRGNSTTEAVADRAGEA
jgi:hypothetical protein